MFSPVLTRPELTSDLCCTRLYKKTLKLIIRISVRRSNYRIQCRLRIPESSTGPTNLPVRSMCESTNLITLHPAPASILTLSVCVQTAYYDSTSI